MKLPCFKKLKKHELFSSLSCNLMTHNLKDEAVASDDSQSLSSISPETSVEGVIKSILNRYTDASSRHFDLKRVMTTRP